MSNKKTIIIMILAVSFVAAIVIGATYAWYSYENASTAINGTTIKEAPAVIFSQTEFIKDSEIVPIQDKDRYNYATKNSFLVTMGTNLSKYEVNIQISLKNINISEELKTSNYKYELLCDDNIIASSDFSNLSTDKIDLIPMTLLKPETYPHTYKYELLIWLSDNGEKQNDLMNKSFSAQISVISAVKK